MYVVVITGSWLRCFCKLYTKQEGGLLGREVHVLGQELKEIVLCMGNCKAKRHDGIPTQKRKVLVAKIEVTEELSKLFITNTSRGELSYLAPLGSENISAPYFKQCFFREGGYYPPD